jgi:hypothetical protein
MLDANMDLFNFILLKYNQYIFYLI